MKFLAKKQKTRCVLEDEGAEPCPPPVNSRFPICDNHINELNKTLVDLQIADYIRENFMIKGEESFLFDRRNGSVYSLNQTGTFIFTQILSGKDFCTILEQIMDTFDANLFADALDDCKGFIGEILKLGLLIPKDAT
jgi:hypothetical protein